MRFIIETNEKEVIDSLCKDNSGFELIDQYEPIERLSARVEKMRLAFEEFKKNRGNWNIMNYYLRGRGISQSEINNVLSGVEEFLQQIK